MDRALLAPQFMSVDGSRRNRDSKANGNIPGMAS